jgi:predicted metalloprotease
MRWQDGRRSTNVEDRRGQIVKGGAIGGAGIIVLLLVAVLLGADPGTVLSQVTESGLGGGITQSGTISAEEAQLADLVSVVLGYTEDTWTEIFRENGVTYRYPSLVLFSGGVESACGYAQSATGPFYCPNDEKVYIDLSFYQELKDQFGAPGDFAQAYVIAHEVGHHVQNQFGILDQVSDIQRRSDEVTANRYSVMLELQADCYAGVWANRANTEHRIIEAGDVEEAMNAASKIGDDNLQKQTQGYVVPDSFTHGSSAQRMQWFRTGFQSGDINSCDTFSGAVV